MKPDLVMTSLPKICEVVTDGTHDSPKLVDKGIPFIKGKHISSGRIDFSTCDYISEQDHQKCIRRIKPQIDDILFSNIGSVGDVARVKEDTEFSIKNIALFRPDPDKVNPSYLYYLVKSPKFRGRFLSIRSGAAQPFISLKNFRTVNFEYIQDIKKQAKIGLVLSAYDSLIENNLRRIELLEKAAKTLYNEWFVQLRFPGYEHTKIVDGVPEGWLKIPISETSEFINGFAFKPSHQESAGLPIVKIPELRTGVSSKTPRNSGSHIPEKYHINSGDLIFSWSGSLVVSFWNNGPALLNQHLFKVDPKESFSKSFVYLALIEALPKFMNLAVGATMKHIRRSALNEVSVLVPNSRTGDLFEEHVAPILNLGQNLEKQNIELAKARDLLLPKLMSGEIAV